ncbi:hypothetical protein AK830_g6367 [Neonectria ditissima]|uniref:Diphthine methyltransferase n=1 Tax=Neonectria ditissima TaxID=78410 RepID=A0A0P7BIM7_9HYPO|nr:hypothetical protein AK830_g6367 [Neonectria ditissima]
MGSPNVVSSKVSLTLDLPPSCIQFCPAHPELFIVGTYNLQRDESAGQIEGGNDEDVLAAKTPQNRNGSLMVFRIRGTELTLVQTVTQPSAILDLRFHPAPGRQDILAVVSSTGTLAVFKLDPEEDAVSPLKHVATSRCDDIPDDVLFLQCNWHPLDPSALAVTTSTGGARLLRLNDEYRITDSSLDLAIANSLEAWCINFSPASSDASEVVDAQVTAYCGGDDSMLRYMSLRSGSADEEPHGESPYPPIMIKGTHTAGVTAILPLSLIAKDKGRIVVTGSYDDRLRVFIIHDLHETYGLKRVELVLEENLDGGVWRLDLVDTHQRNGSLRIRILASCMHAGARLIEVEARDEQSWTCKVLAQFEEHKSMNYGSDFVRGGEGDGLRCVSTSFYDKLLCIWDYEPSA